MAKYLDSIEQSIGNTPLVRLRAIEQAHGLKAALFAKAEYFNPTGSVKDRAAKFMLDAAEKEGKLVPGATIIEPTSGNTGIGLCSIAVQRGYRTIIVMPETMSLERRRMMAAYGAELVLTEGKKGMKGAIEKANELHAEIPDSFIPAQFDNPANVRAHFEGTGPEIYDALDGKVDAFVAGVQLRGKSVAGEKTMLDAMIPARDAFKAALDAGKGAKDALADAVAAAEQGVEYTKTIIATKGRASYLGERSLGHQDPGATSFTTMLKVAAAHV